MASQYPASFDAFDNPTASSTMSDVGVVHHEQHANANDAIEAIESTLGTNPQDGHASVAARILHTETQIAQFLPLLGQSTTAWDTFPRWGLSSAAGGNLRAICTMFTPLVNIPVTQITMGTASVGMSGTSTLVRMGLYQWNIATDSGTLLARTAHDDTLFRGQYTLFTRSFSTTGGYPSSVTLQAGQRYATAVLCVGASTSPNFTGLQNQVGALQGLSPRMWGAKDNLYELPDTLSGLVDSYNIWGVPWARLS